MNYFNIQMLLSAFGSVARFDRRAGFCRGVKIVVRHKGHFVANKEIFI